MASAQQDYDTAETIEALFMGSGQLMPSDGFAACPYRGFWSGFPRETIVTVRISTTVSDTVKTAIQMALKHVPEATNGAIVTRFETADDPNPMPERNQVTLTFHPDPTGQGCPYDRGCTMHRFVPGKPGVLVSSRAVQPPGMPTNAYVHDVVGHGILGLCHIDGTLIGGPEYSLMSGGPGVFSGQIGIRPTPLDIEAARLVYQSPLSPGATRRDFIRHGLIAD